MQRSEARALLGLSPTCSVADIEIAFRRQALLAHPDRGGDPERFKALVESRRVLLYHHAQYPNVIVIDSRPRAIRWLKRLRKLRATQVPRVL